VEVQYETGEKLLAERMFDYPDIPRFYWRREKLGFDAWLDPASIALPPTLLDRWRTRWP